MHSSPGHRACAATVQCPGTFQRRWRRHDGAGRSTQTRLIECDAGALLVHRQPWCGCDYFGMGNVDIPELAQCAFDRRRGSTTAVAGAPNPRREEMAATSGGGATTETDGKPPRRPAAAWISGGGPTADPGAPGTLNFERAVAENGMAGSALLEPGTSGCPGWPSLRSGGTTRPGLPSRATWIRDCGAALAFTRAFSC